MTGTSNITVSTGEGACVFCNTVRPTQQVLCPNCGRGWIDLDAMDSAESVANAEAAAIRTMSTGKSLRIKRSSYRRGWWIPVVAAVIALGVYWLAAQIASDGSTETASTQPLPTTPAPPTTDVTQQPPTTLPPASTTVSPSTTTTTTTTALPAFAAGEAIPLDELRLGAAELGPFALGEAAEGAIEGLVATFGQPTGLGDADESWGLCPGDGGRVISFGGLHVITRSVSGEEVLAGYVLEQADHASEGLLTFSGAGLTTTLGEMDAIYRRFETGTEDGRSLWVVRSANDGTTLLWGPAADTTPDQPLDSIASPRACDGGPFLD